jgi:hypothetical protein
LKAEYGTQQERLFLWEVTVEWLFAKTYSKTIQGNCQDFDTVTYKHHKPLFINNFSNSGAKE